MQDENRPDQQNRTITLRFRLGKGGRWLLYTLLGIFIYQFLTLQRPGFGELAPLLRGDWKAYFQALFGYYFLFELVSVFIFMRLVRPYFRWAKMMQLELSPRGFFRHQLRFLPFVLVVIPVFGPVTNTLRYLAFFYPNYSWETYFPEYFFTAQMYINYLLPFLFFGYAMLNVNLFLDFNDWQKTGLAWQENQAGDAENKFLQVLEAHDAEGETMLPVAEVLWFEVEGKNYWAYTRGKTYAVRMNLAELEAALNPALFFRVNRAVIVNLSFLKNYSFWENDKYILRLSDGKTEFVMQRTRLKILRARLSSSSNSAFH